jgi:hypothetical protein
MLVVSQFKKIVQYIKSKIIYFIAVGLLCLTAFYFFFSIKKKEFYDLYLNQNADNKKKLDYKDDIEFLKRIYE